MDDNGSVLTPRPKTKFKGTVRFAPLATHKQEELGRKDDIESWIFMIVDMLRAERLPWHEIDDRRIVEQKKADAMANPDKLFNAQVSWKFYYSLFHPVIISYSFQQLELRDICTYLATLHYVDNLDYSWIRYVSFIFS